jgi:hypothetical protein
MTTAQGITSLACTLALALGAGAAAAAPQPWMRSDNPQGLYVLLSVGEECAVRRTEADVAVQAAFTRLDVPRASGWAPGELFLTAEVDCTQTTNYPDIYLYVTRVGFAVNYQEQPAYMMQYVRGRYESFGIDSLGNIDRILTESVVAALTDYEAANAGPAGADDAGRSAAGEAQ